MGTVSATAWQFVRIAAQAATVVVAARLLGPDLFGVALALYGLAVIAGGWVGLGAGYLLLRDVSQDPRTQGMAWRAAVSRCVVTGAVLTVAYVMVAAALLDAAVATITLVVIGFTELLLQPLAYLCGFLLQARDRVGEGAAVQAAMSAARLAGISIVGSATGALTLGSYAWGIGAGVVFGAALCRLWVRYRLGPMPALQGGSPHVADGLPFAASWSTSVALGELDKVLAFRLIGADAAGVYGVAYRVAVALAVPASALAYALQPRMFRASASSAGQEAGSTPAIAALATFLYGCLAGVAMLFLADLVPPFLGAGFEGASAAIRAMVPLTLVLCLRIVASNILGSLGEPARRAATEACAVGLIMVLSLLLLPNHGIMTLVVIVTVVEAMLVLALGWQIKQVIRRR